MRALIGIIIVVVVLALLGWITLNYREGQTSINFETEKARQDVDAAIDSVDRAADELAEERLQDDGFRDDGFDDQPVAPATDSTLTP